MNNPPAFPRASDGPSGAIPQTGMTLRDYFAAAVMQGMVSSTERSDKLAQWAYEQADAMLKAREQ